MYPGVAESASPVSWSILWQSRKIRFCSDDIQAPNSRVLVSQSKLTSADQPSRPSYILDEGRAIWIGEIAGNDVTVAVLARQDEIRP